MADYLNIAGRIRTTASDGVAMEAQEVKDLNLNKSQQEVNADVQTKLGDRYTKEETYSKEQLDSLITSPDVSYVTVVATDQTTDVTDLLPVTGEDDTIYRVGNWDGTQYDTTVFSLYVWDGSDYVCLAVRSFVGEVYDISANHPDGQGDPTTYADLTAAIGTDGANVPSGIRRGGMSIKFIQTSDNKYVQYRLMSDEWSTNTEDWAIAEEGVYVENPEFIYVKTDAEDRILWAIKADGTVYFGAGVPPQVVDYINGKITELGLSDVNAIKAFLGDYVGGDNTLQALLAGKLDSEGLDSNALGSVSVVENPEFMEVESDSEDRILGGRKIDGTKFENLPFELQGVRQEVVDDSAWVEIKTDNEDKIIEGINTSGEKHISKFDNETEDMIKGLVDIPESIPSVINIPLLDANFTSPVPVTITGTKGDENAKYEFELPLSEDAFNIRCKFRVTDNLLNQEKTAKVLQLGNAVINATPASLSQYTSEVEYNANTVTMLWPDFNGGIRYGNSSEYKIGNYAFYIKYTGTESSASIENNGTKFILKTGSITTEFDYSTYETVASLYDALKVMPDIEVAYKEVEGRNSSELAVFPECQIKMTCYTRISRFETGQIEEYVDTPPFFVPYAVDDTWHQIEIVKIGNSIYCACDGATQVLTYDKTTYDYSKLTLGDGSLMLFKELVIDTNSPSDAEIYTKRTRIVSSANPAIVIFEGHGMYDGTISESSIAPDDMVTSTDRLYYVFGKMRTMGYVPVSVHDISDFYAGEKELPKRCYTIIFDDFRWENCLNANYRKVFKELGVHPALAINTDRNTAISHNGSIITKKEAAEICLRNDFGLLSHTRDHWKLDSVRLSTLISEFTQDIYSADNCLVDGMIIVYPGGKYTNYALSTLKWLGYSLGIDIAYADNSYVNNLKDRNKYRIVRVEIGIRTTPEVIFNKII